MCLFAHINPRLRITELVFNYFTLSFSKEWAHLEPEFLKYHFRESLPGIRVVIPLLILFYTGFGVLDAILAPEYLTEFWTTRFIVAYPISGTILWLSFKPGFHKISQPALFFMCLSGGIGIILMIIISGPPASYSYYAGIILVFIAIFAILRMRFLWGTACTWLIVASYEAGAFFFSDTPMIIIINNNFFFISASLFCMLAGYTIEKNARKTFFSNHMLQLANNEIARINDELDSRVRERTKELLNQTEKLKEEINGRQKSEARNRELKSKLIQAHKMESIGVLAGGIAHDFNNVLASIIGYTELAIEQVDKQSELDEFLQGIFAGGNRAKELVGQILTFARQADDDVKPVQISQTANETLSLVRASIPSTIEIRSDIRTNALVMGNETRIHQIMMNLFTNAYHAMEKTGGNIDFRVRDLNSGSAHLDNPELSNGPWVKISISDTGTGIDKRILNSIFDPYFTTKKTGKGTGMGLAMVHGIVESYNGKINVESQPGHGSTFTIYLPATDKPSKVKPGLVQNAPKGSERILFVDDEDAILQMNRILLSGLGYSVTAIASPLEALALFQKDPEAFDLVITDMVMPKMTGNALVEKLKRIRNDIPVILCTGYTTEISREKAAAMGINAFLLKPVTRNKLAETIRETLDAD